MTKSEFLDQLRGRLSGLPQSDLEERLNFYGEMIDDRIEDGLKEEDAVAAVGSVGEIAEQIVKDTPLAKLVKEKIKPKRSLKSWEIVLIAVGSPIWFALLVAAFAVMISVYAVIWSLIVSLWAVGFSLAVSFICGLAVGLVFIFKGSALPGLVIIGAALICAGLAIFAFFGCKAATKGAVALTKEIAAGIKRPFIKKEEKK